MTRVLVMPLPSSWQSCLGAKFGVPVVHNPGKSHGSTDVNVSEVFSRWIQNAYDVIFTREPLEREFHGGPGIGVHPTLAAGSGDGMRIDLSGVNTSIADFTIIVIADDHYIVSVVSCRMSIALLNNLFETGEDKDRSLP